MARVANPLEASATSPWARPPKGPVSSHLAMTALEVPVQAAGLECGSQGVLLVLGQRGKRSHFVLVNEGSPKAAPIIKPVTYIKEIHGLTLVKREGGVVLYWAPGRAGKPQ